MVVESGSRGSLLSRYGGENGPTGHASTDGADGPVSLSQFIGGKAGAPRKGHLTGDGRAAPPEAALAGESVARALPGLADPNARSMASFLREREQRLFGTEQNAEEAKHVAAEARREAAEAKAVADAARLKAESAEKMSIMLCNDAEEGDGKAAVDINDHKAVDAQETGAGRANEGAADDAKDTTATKEVGGGEGAHGATECNASDKRITVLISGSGSNFQAIIDATSGTKPRIPNAHVMRVISNRMNAYGLERAKKASPPIPTGVMSLKTYQNRHPGASREDYDLALARKILEDGEPDIVVLAGFMHIVSETFLNALGHNTSLPPQPDAPRHAVPIINLHPALPGAFDGANAIDRAYEAFQKGEITHTGIMVHEVVAEVDRGQPIIVEEVPIVRGEPLDELETRMHSVEHRLIVEATRRVLEEAHTFGKTCESVYRALPDDRKLKGEADAAAAAAGTAAAPAAVKSAPTTSDSKYAAKAFFVKPPTALSSASITSPFVVTDNDVLLVTGATTYLWHGRHAPAVSSASLEPAVHIRQGEEPVEFVSAVGGVLVTKLSAGTGQFAVRHTASGIFIDECGPEMFCSAYSAVIPGHVWHGVGSDAAQCDAARNWAAHFGRVSEHTEGDGWNLAPEYASGWHHRYWASIPAHERSALVFTQKHPSGTSFTSDAVSPDEVAVVAAPLEVYVLVGANARGNRAQISAALDRAESIAQDMMQRRGRHVLRPAVLVVVFPTVVLADLAAAARFWDDAHLQLTFDKTKPEFMNVHNLAEARAQLAAGDGARGRAGLTDYLPVGTAPQPLITKKIPLCRS